MSKKQRLLAPSLSGSAESAAPRPTWLTQPCPPWCDEDHREQDYYSDRHHFVSLESIDLSLYDAVGSDNVVQPGTLDLSAFQHYRHAEPDIELVLPQCKAGGRRVEGETSLALTVQEALILRDRLSAILVLVGAEETATPQL